MCGIAGYTGHRIDGLVETMIDAIRHRGPDGDGHWSGGGVHFGHTRLAIVDVKGGDQPMVRSFANRTIAVTYNGEIYNYDSLRAEIEAAGFQFDGHCDTELLPLGFAAFGVEIFKKINGMFAVALWDTQTESLYLARDSFGIKPLYYAHAGTNISFSSSIEGIVRHPDVSRSLDPNAIRDFLQFRYATDGQVFYEAVKTLSPGHIAIWKKGAFESTPFWTPTDGLIEHRTNATTATVELANALSESHRLQLRSDVPVGVFLSGGVDSATVAHFASRHSQEHLRAFTFATRGNDESELAKQIATATGMDHTVISFDDANPLDDLYDAVACMDAPVGDAIVVPTYQLCRSAASTVKVALTGEGADELFGGYVHYPVLQKLGSLAGIPGIGALSALVRVLPVSVLDKLFHYDASLGRLGRTRAAEMVESIRQSGRLARLAASVLSDDDIDAATMLPPPPSPPTVNLDLRSLMIDGIKTWLPNQILNKMDQLSMAHGLETRVPFLDPVIWPIIANAPDNQIMTRRENKVLLRNVMRREGLANAGRRKRAFHVAVESEHKGDLASLAHQWLSEDKLRHFGILKPSYIAKMMNALDAGEFLASKRLVTMISLHMWLDARKASL